MSDDRQIVVQRSKNPQTFFLNFEVTELIFTKFLYNVEALVPLLIHGFAER